MELYRQALEMQGELTEDFTKELVDTEQGKMLKITIPTLRDNVPQPSYDLPPIVVFSYVVP